MLLWPFTRLYWFDIFSWEQVTHKHLLCKFMNFMLFFLSFYCWQQHQQNIGFKPIFHKPQWFKVKKGYKNNNFIFISFFSIYLFLFIYLFSYYTFPFECVAMWRCSNFFWRLLLPLLQTDCSHGCLLACLI